MSGLWAQLPDDPFVRPPAPMVAWPTMDKAAFEALLATMVTAQGAFVTVKQITFAQLKISFICGRKNCGKHDVTGDLSVRAVENVHNTETEELVEESVMDAPLN